MKASNTILRYQEKKKKGYLVTKDMFKIYDSMVKPILCYASGIWVIPIIKRLNLPTRNSARNIVYCLKIVQTILLLVNVDGYHFVSRT